MMNHVMIDLETLGNNMNAPILSIGAVFFDPENNLVHMEPFHDNVAMESTLVCNTFTPDPTTIDWWQKQSLDAKLAVLRDSIALEDVLERLTIYLKSNSNDCLDELIIWGNGSKYDLGILSNAYEKVLGLKSVPWKHYNERDVRTIVALNPKIKEEANNNFEGIKHTPLADCYHQIKYLTKTLGSIRIFD